MIGSVRSLWRYPVKSMLGEGLERADVGEMGLIGDRGYALIDTATGKVASAKHPRLWGRLFECRAAYVADPVPGAALPSVRITLPDGATVTSDDPSVDAALSEALGREVTLTASAPAQPTIVEEWLDLEGVGPHRATTTDESLGAIAPGTFFDAAPLHVLTTSTLARLAKAHADGEFDERRFRPNVVVEAPAEGFVENDWVGKRIHLDQVVMQALIPTPRCVMTTLAQDGLPQDSGVLRAAAQENRLDVPRYGLGACVGVYGVVAQPGTVAVGSDVAE